MASIQAKILYSSPVFQCLLSPYELNLIFEIISLPHMVEAAKSKYETELTERNTH